MSEPTPEELLEAAADPVEIEEEAEAETDYEPEARKQGWCPKEEWRGDPDEWRDAKAFVERGKEIAPHLRKVNERLEKEVQSLKSTIDKLGQYNIESEKRAYERARSDIEAQMEAAAEDGDMTSYRSHKKKLDDLEPPKQEIQAELPPEVAEWAEQNAWFSENPTARQHAIAVAEQFANLPISEKLEKVTESTRSTFPRLFEEQPKPKPAPNPVGGGRRGPSQKARTYNHLPQDAKRMCDEFSAHMAPAAREKFKEQFVKNHDWSQS